MERLGIKHAIQKARKNANLFVQLLENTNNYLERVFKDKNMAGAPMGKAAAEIAKSQEQKS